MSMLFRIVDYMSGLKAQIIAVFIFCVENRNAKRKLMLLSLDKFLVVTQGCMYHISTDFYTRVHGLFLLLLMREFYTLLPVGDCTPIAFSVIADIH